MTLSTAERFRSTIADYVAHRLRYPDALIAGVARLCRIDSASPILDLGTGPGFLAIAFSAYSDDVLGLDPSAEMLAEARRSPGSERVRFEEGSSLTLDRLRPGLALVTMGRSFHWMDRQATLGVLDRLVEPTGAIALFDVKRADRRNAPAWREAYETTIRTWERRLGPDPERSAIKAAPSHPQVLAGSPFSVVVQVSVAMEGRFTPSELVGRARSQSGTSPARLGDHSEAFSAELSAALQPHLEPDGRVTDPVRANATIAFRPGTLVA